eukprot:scaffold14616_cov96-Isochrysis_galbana.AAC.1
MVLRISHSRTAAFGALSMPLTCRRGPFERVQARKKARLVGALGLRAARSMHMEDRSGLKRMCSAARAVGRDARHGWRHVI